MNRDAVFGSRVSAGLLGRGRDQIVADRADNTFQQTYLYRYLLAYEAHDLSKLLSYMNDEQQIAWARFYMKAKPTTARNRVLFSYGRKVDGPIGGVDIPNKRFERALLRAAFVVLASPSIAKTR